MRNSFLNELNELARDQKDLFLVVGDLGYSVVEPFAASFPERYVNAGIAEQAMTGMAAGLGMCGYNVFTYSIANFPTLRCLEQIRNDVCYHRSNVKIVSVGAGLAYGSLGYSHHAVQDIGCLRGFPGILMATPGDPFESKAATRFLSKYTGPAYLRLGKAGEKNVHSDDLPNLAYPCFQEVIPGSDSCILACGSILAVAKDVAFRLGSKLVSAVLWSDDAATREAIIGLVQRHKRVVVAEEHLLSGGFGSFVRECLESEPALQARVRIVALSNDVCGTVGSQDYLRGIGGLTANSIEAALK